MANDNDALAEAVRLIKAGKKEEARSILEPLLRTNPNHVQAWMWEAGTFPDDADKLRILESCLKHNPGNAQVLQAIALLKKRVDVNGPGQSTGTSKIQKKSRPMSPGMKNAIIAGGTLVAFLCLVSLYVAGGIYMNGQINQAFAQQNCAAVVQNASFVSIYPNAIFASMFSGYDQYGECRLKLSVEQALAANNLGEALTYSQQYVATYPNGTFAPSISEQAPVILLTWCQQLIDNKDYANGIDRLKQLAETYPASPSAQGTQDMILQTYLLWTDELSAKQSYAEAEQRLTTALAYFEADTARSEQIKQALVDVYVAWGDMQIQLGDLDNGIRHYQMAGEISPGTVDVELLTARAGLQKAITLADTGNFDGALEKVQEIADSTAAENVISEANAAQETILAAYSVSTSQQAIDRMNLAVAETCAGHSPSLPIFGRDTEKMRFGLTNFYVTLPPNWAAETPSQLRYVICVDETDEELQTCPYTGGHFLVRMRYVWKVSLHDILGEKKYSPKTFRGTNPDQCPATATFQTTSTISRSFGRRPTIDEILAWLDPMNLRK